MYKNRWDIPSVFVLSLVVLLVLAAVLLVLATVLVLLVVLLILLVLVTVLILVHKEFPPEYFLWYRKGSMLGFL